MQRYFYLLPLLSILLLASCSPKLTPFTKDLYKDYGWTENELKQIQFYVSEDIKLFRARKQGVSEVSNGEIKVIDGMTSEVINIPAGTPGTLLFLADKNKFAVSFEPENEKLFLMFGPGKDLDGRFVLLASEWNKRTGVITYGKKKYKTKASSAWATLMVDMKKVTDTKYEVRTAKGREIE